MEDYNVELSVCFDDEVWNDGTGNFVFEVYMLVNELEDTTFHDDDFSDDTNLPERKYYTAYSKDGIRETRKICVSKNVVLNF